MKLYYNVVAHKFAKTLLHWTCLKETICHTYMASVKITPTINADYEKFISVGVNF